MSIRGWLLLACAGFGATYAIGEFFSSPLLPSAELLAWVALAAYLVVAGRDAPLRVRLALAAGLVILGGLAAVTLFSTVDTAVTGFQFLAPYQGSPPSALETAAGAVRQVLPVLLAYACLALAALLLPGRRTRAGIAVAAAGVSIAVIYAGLELWSREGELVSVLAAVPPVLVAVLAFVVAGRARGWVPTAGLALLGLAALSLLGDVLDRTYVPLYEANAYFVTLHETDAFLEPGLLYSERATAATSLGAVVGPHSYGLGLGPAIQLLAAATITAGCLRRRPTVE